MKVITTTADARREAHRLLDLETRAAWLQYLATTRNALSYETVEPFAWAQLGRRLARIAARRDRLQ